MNEWRNEMNWRMNGMWMKWMDKWIQLMKWIHATSSYSSQLYPRNQWDTVGYVHIANAESFCLEGRIALSIYLSTYLLNRTTLLGGAWGAHIPHSWHKKTEIFCQLYGIWVYPNSFGRKSPRMLVFNCDFEHSRNTTSSTWTTTWQNITYFDTSMNCLPTVW